MPNLIQTYYKVWRTNLTFLKNGFAISKKTRKFAFLKIDTFYIYPFMYQGRTPALKLEGWVKKVYISIRRQRIKICI